MSLTASITEHEGFDVARVALLQSGHQTGRTAVDHAVPGRRGRRRSVNGDAGLLGPHRAPGGCYGSCPLLRCSRSPRRTSRAPTRADLDSTQEHRLPETNGAYDLLAHADGPGGRSKIDMTLGPRPASLLPSCPNEGGNRSTCGRMLFLSFALRLLAGHPRGATGAGDISQRRWQYLNYYWGVWRESHGNGGSVRAPMTARRMARQTAPRETHLPSCLIAALPGE